MDRKEQREAFSELLSQSPYDDAITINVNRVELSWTDRLSAFKKCEERYGFGKKEIMKAFSEMDEEVAEGTEAFKRMMDATAKMVYVGLVPFEEEMTDGGTLDYDVIREKVKPEILETEGFQKMTQRVMGSPDRNAYVPKGAKAGK